MTHKSLKSIAAAACAACVRAGAIAADSEPNPWDPRWSPDLGYFDDGPRCLLNGPEAEGTPGRTFHYSFYWRASEGHVLWLKVRHEEFPAVHVESGEGERWPVTVEPLDPRKDGRQARLPARVADGMLRSLEQGRPLTMVLTFGDGTALRYRVPTPGAEFAMPMFRACVKSLTDEPVEYVFTPKVRYLGSFEAYKRCSFGQLVERGHFPVLVSMRADGDGGEMLFQRPVKSQTPHGPFRQRKTPDRIEARQLYGQEFELVEESRYGISTYQVNELAADFSRGATREFSLTTPEGKKSTLVFGGTLGKPFAAMFAACRKARESTKHPETQ
jgi:hypothetical protein